MKMEPCKTAQSYKGWAPCCINVLIVIWFNRVGKRTSPNAIKGVYVPICRKYPHQTSAQIIKPYLHRFDVTQKPKRDLKVEQDSEYATFCVQYRQIREKTIFAGSQCFNCGHNFL